MEQFLTPVPHSKFCTNPKFCTIGLRQEFDDYKREQNKLRTELREVLKEHITLNRCLNENIESIKILERIIEIETKKKKLNETIIALAKEEIEENADGN